MFEALHPLQYREAIIDKIGYAQFLADIDLFFISPAEVDIFSRDAGLFPKARPPEAEKEKDPRNHAGAGYNIHIIKMTRLDNSRQAFERIRHNAYEGIKDYLAAIDSEYSHSS
jgi:hypothetical protein